MKKRNSFRSDYGFWAVMAAAAIYTALLGTICVLKYQAFSYNDFDFAVHIQKYWNILHGNTSIAMFGDTKIWGNSLEVIAIFYSFIYWCLFMSPAALLVLQSLILGLGAIPIYLIARRNLPQGLSIAVAVSYLLYPALWFVNLYEYHDMVLATLTLLFAFYFLEEGRFGYFLLSVILSVFCRADIALATLMLGVYAFLTKKSLRWFISPLAFSLLWIIVGLFIILPRFQTAIRYDVFYQHFGRGFPEIAKNMLLHPDLLLKVLLTKQNAVFMFKILFPVWFVSLLGAGELMIAALSLIQHLASGRGTEHTIFFHYTIAITPFVYISAIYGLNRLLAAKFNKRVLLALILVFSLAANLWYGPLSNISSLLSQLKRDNLDIYKESLLKKIPRDAAVISTFEFTPRLSNRRYLYSFHYVYFGKIPFTQQVYETPANIEYALINFTDYLMVGSFWNPQAARNMQDFLEKDNWGLVDMMDNIALFKKGYPNHLKLYEVKKNAIESPNPLLRIADFMQLSDYSFKTSRFGREVVVNMSFKWRCLKKITEDLVMIFQVFDKDNKLVYESMKPICFGIYPTYRWSKDETVIDNYNLLLPAHLTAGKYQLKMFLFSINSGKIVSMAKGKGGPSVVPQRAWLGEIGL